MGLARLEQLYVQLNSGCSHISAPQSNSHYTCKHVARPHTWHEAQCEYVFLVKNY